MAPAPAHHDITVITFQLGPGHRRCSTAHVRPAAPLSTDGALILNVDDNDGGRYAKSRVLVRAGYRVIEAANGTDALEKAEREQPSLMVLDVMLPDINGVEVCRRIKASPLTQSILVLQTSASAIHSRDRVYAFAGGADSVLVEPIEPEELIAHVKALLRLKAAEQALLDADRRKDEFLAMLAHELRNPLAPIRNAVELLRLSQPAQAGIPLKAREIIARQVDHLSKLVDELLDVSRITHGKITLVKEPVLLASLLQSATEAVLPLIDRRRHTFKTVAPDEDIWMSADPTRLSQVLGNLLNNAAKYTPEQGEITLSVRNEGGNVSIAVQDNGIGIAAEALPQVFDLFMQAAPSLDRAQGGLGIGLSLAQTLTRMHGGQISAASPGVGLGCTFTVDLPIGLPSTWTQAAPQPSVSTGRPLKILVVEDNRDAALGMELLLTARGHTVQTAGDGLSGLAMATAMQPDVVILDIGLPAMDGYQLAHALRSTPATAHLPLVALSGYGQETDKLKSAAAGIAHHLVKPVTLASLEAVLTAL